MSTIVSSLTEDLLMEVLSRLPIKSIVQCKSICKSWCTLISSNHFIIFQLNHVNKRCPKLILASNYHKIFHSLDYKNCNAPVFVNLKLPKFGGTSIVGSCNGLICLSNFKTFISLWNPSIREFVQLPCDDPVIKNELCGVVMGFGYDGVCEKYKLVRIEYFYDLDGSDFMMDFNRVEVKVYTLGSNVWRLVDNTPCCYIGNINRVAHVDGVLYWIGLRGVGVGSWKSIVSFDLRNEKFGEVSWPAFEDSSYRDLGLGVLQGSLCTFSFHLECVDIWMIKNYGVKGTWTKHFSIARSTKHLEPLFLLKSGEILLQMGLGSLLFYDPASDITRAPSVSGIPDRLRTSTYVESLVPIASLMGMPGNSLATKISTGIKNKLHEEK